MNKSVKKMIKHCILGTAACLICSGNPAWAGVTLQIPSNITIVAENGKKANIGKEASLPDGDNQIVVQFQGDLSKKHADENSDFECSDTFVVRFNASSQSLKMVIPRIKRLLELDKWNKSPNIRILDSGNRDLDIRVARLEKDGFQVFRDYEAELNAFNKTDSPAALSTLSSGYQDTVSKPVPAAAATSPKYQPRQPQAQPQGKSGMAEDMLEYWYQQADEQTKARFKQRINKQ